MRCVAWCSGVLLYKPISTPESPCAYAFANGKRTTKKGNNFVIIAFVVAILFLGLIRVQKARSRSKYQSAITFRSRSCRSYFKANNTF